MSPVLGRYRRRRRQQQVDGAMRDLAIAFMATASRAGHPLELSQASAAGLDAAMATLLSTDVTPAKVGGAVRGAAAYLGQIVVEAEVAAWVLLPGSERAVLAILPDGDPVLNLVSIVDRRIRGNRPETLAEFLDRCLAGFERPPDPSETASSLPEAGSAASGDGPDDADADDP